ncbi:MAG TPA: hypothetical protein VHB78_07650 [Vicinamibacterales bacterium]|nr:hypothetical protein [Vicinamibacterales bacterium]
MVTRSGLAALLVAASAVWLSAQAMAISTSGDLLRVTAPGFGVLDAPVVEQLRDGRSVRVGADLAVRERPDGAIVAEAHETFALSFDLWEERYAITRVGTPSLSISHLRARDAEAWCLAHLAVSLSEVGRIGRDTPFWIRLQYRVLNPERVPTSDEPFSLGGLIEILGRRRAGEAAPKTLDGGPFRLSALPRPTP